ncbi:MAG: AsmA family protein, partial [Deltaproteobacteria bacterium]|nr:AsmA family protein [Deltaproteobacteria bacterium]
MGRKRIFIVVAAAIAGLLIGGELLTSYLRLEDQRRTIERRLSEAAGLEVSIGDDLRLHLFPAPRFEVADVTVANLPGRPSPHLLAIDSVDLAFDSWRLLLGAIEIDHLTLVGVEAHVETDAQGGFAVAHDADALVDEEVSG